MSRLVARLLRRALVAAVAVAIVGAAGRRPGLGVRLLLASGGGRHAAHGRWLSGLLVTRSARAYRRRAAARHRTRQRRPANPGVPEERRDPNACVACIDVPGGS